MRRRKRREEEESLVPRVLNTQFQLYSQSPIHLAHLNANMDDEPCLGALATTCLGDCDTQREEEAKGKKHEDTMKVSIAEPNVIACNLCAAGQVP